MNTKQENTQKRVKKAQQLIEILCQDAKKRWRSDLIRCIVFDFLAHHLGTKVKACYRTGKLTKTAEKIWRNYKPKEI